MDFTAPTSVGNRFIADNFRRNLDYKLVTSSARLLNSYLPSQILLPRPPPSAMSPSEWRLVRARTPFLVIDGRALIPDVLLVRETLGGWVLKQ